MVKVCTKCEKEKILTDFAVCQRGRLGRHSRCRKCRNEAKRLWHAQNRDSQIEKMRDYQHRNRSVLVEKKRIKNSLYREDLARKSRERYDQEKARKAVRSYRARNPEQHRAQEAVRKLVLKGVFPPVSTMVCDGCQESIAKHWHHHKGYVGDYKTDVVALCTGCHGKAHWRELNA